MVKKAISVFMAMLLTMSLGATAFASEDHDKNIAGEPVDRSGEIVRVDIPNGDGTFTTLEGAKAQAWYNGLVTEEEGTETQNMTLETARTEGKIETRGAFRYRYRYLESNRTNDVERRSLEKTVTNKIRNTSSTTQTYTLNLSVSQSWSISRSITGEYEKVVKATLGESWGKTYSKNESFQVNVQPGKTLWVTFIPIMDKSEGKAQKYFIPRGGLYKKPIVVKSYDVVTYNPKYLSTKMGPFTIKSVYGIYVYREA